MNRLKDIARCWVFILAFAPLFFPWNLSWAGKAMTGQELAQRVYDRYVGNNSWAEVTMELVNRQGQKRLRKLTMISQDKEGKRYSLIRFLTPADIAGTGFLSLEKDDGSTEQFLYLPALKRVRRVVSSQKGRSFVNSDFSYEDMERRPLSDATYKILGEKKVGNLDCWILESRMLPRAKSKYFKIVSYVPKGLFLSIEAEYYDRQGRLIKHYQVYKLEKIQGIWTPLFFEMQSLKKKHLTRMEILKIVYNDTKVDQGIFTKNYLSRW